MFLIRKNMLYLSIFTLFVVWFCGDSRADVASWQLRPETYSFEKPAVCPVKASKRHGYKVCDDQVAILESALAKARAEGKLLVIKFGAEWCPWCRKLHKVIPSDKVLKYQKDGFGYDKKYDLVEIAINTAVRGKGVVDVPSGALVSDGLLKQLNVAKSRVKGIPYLVIIDPSHPGKGAYIRSKYLETRFLGLFYHYKGVSYEPANIRAMLQKNWYRFRK